MSIILTILLINIVYVSFFTIRTILTLKGHKLMASSISSIEVFIYLMGLNLVLDDLNQIENVFAYCLGFGLGILVGMKIEEWMALGYVTVQVITKKTDQSVADWLRAQGFGVTSWLSQGKDGDCLTMQILTRRKAQKKLYHHILAYDPKAFIISYEPKHFHGGFWVRNLKKHQQAGAAPATEMRMPGVNQSAIKDIQEQYGDEWGKKSRRLEQSCNSDAIGDKKARR